MAGTGGARTGAGRRRQYWRAWLNPEVWYELRYITETHNEMARGVPRTELETADWLLREAIRREFEMCRKVREALPEREALRKQRVNAEAIADGLGPQHPSEY